MKEYVLVNVEIYVVLTSALLGCVWPESHPGLFTTDFHRIGGCVGFGTSLDDMKRRREEILVSSRFDG
jgi:hypothetical protein